MAKIGTTLVVCALVASMVVAVESALTTCGQVRGPLNPCISYLKGKVGLSAACCNGVRALKNAAKTPRDRQFVCKCLKDAASNVRSINFNLARGLPGKCGVQVPYNISPSIDCSKIRRVK